MEEITEIMCEKISKISIDSVDEGTIDRVKLFIADYYASGLAGKMINSDFNKRMVEFLKQNQSGGDVRSIFVNEKFNPMTSAYVNALYVHGADLDDGNRVAAGHIGTSVISAVFSLAQKRKSKWEEVFLAIISGYEVFCRVAGLAQPILYKKGFHSTGVAGGLASAVACAKLIRLEEAQIYSSLSLGALQSSGTLIIDESGQECKPINPANAARIGVESALMAEKGIKGPRKPLESSKGWFKIFSANYKDNDIISDFGNPYKICESYIKLYPTCRHTHACIDASIYLSKRMVEENLKLEDISRVIIHIYPNAIKSSGKIKKPTNTGEAKFSISYAVAKSLINKTFELKDLFVEEDILVDFLIERIDLFEDAAFEDRESGIRGCKVTIMFRDGRRLDKVVVKPKGEGEPFITWTDMEEKMLKCAMNEISEKDVERLVGKCKEIDMFEGYENFL